jgi:hypothetical protein
MKFIWENKESEREEKKKKDQERIGTSKIPTLIQVMANLEINKDLNETEREEKKNWNKQDTNSDSSDGESGN